MRAWGSGAAPLPVEIVEPFEKKFGGRILEGYGLTEASPVVSAHRLSGPRKLGSVGQPIPGVTISIQDDDDRALPADEIGEVCVQGANVMTRLLPQPGGDGPHRARRVAPHRRHGAARRGRLPLHRRAQEGPDHPRRLQHLSRGRSRRSLYAIPQVAEAAVVGMTDPVMGEDVVAFVVLKDGARATAPEIDGVLRDSPGALQVPEAGPLRGFAPQEPDREDSTQRAPHTGVRRRPWPTTLSRACSGTGSSKTDDRAAQRYKARRHLADAHAGARSARSCASWPPGCSRSGVGRTTRSAFSRRAARSGCRRTSRSSRPGAARFRSTRPIRPI